jgi:hypothetical protein
VINTSTEHFSSNQWWTNLPEGTRVVLQGNNMNHDDHVSSVSNLDEFCYQYQLSELVYKGEKDFVYPGWKFTRYMLIGIK